MQHGRILQNRGERSVTGNMMIPACLTAVQAGKHAVTAGDVIPLPAPPPRYFCINFVVCYC